MQEYFFIAQDHVCKCFSAFPAYNRHEAPGDRWEDSWRQQRWNTDAVPLSTLTLGQHQRTDEWEG